MLKQTISPDKTLFFTGETITFNLTLPSGKLSGRAVLRTNIGGSSAKFTEQIEKTELSRTPKGSDWRDFEMHNTGGGCCQLTMPLTEPGVFEAKCCLIPPDNAPVIWADGDNLKIKVSSCANVSGNGIYCCFVRQFGKWMYLPHSPEQPDFSILDREGFIVIPPSGTFRNVIKHLDHIFNTLNCRILQLLPIHPAPVSFGRMGRYGSPFAATDYFAVDPMLADFDTAVTPMEQFGELIDAVHARSGRIFMDLPVNHTGWASKIQSEHPDYFCRRENGEFISPGAWGVVWEDLCQLDYQRKEVHDLMAKVFLFWCRRGVDGFRCDAGYMVPEPAWDYIIAKVRREYPDTTFLLEGLGGPPEVQKRLLEKSGLDWGYSELFQNFTRDAINNYYPAMNQSVKNGGTLVNFAETHDNLRLGASGKTFARNRFLVNALLSANGTFGFANGAEFFAEEKIDVHQCGALNFAAVDNLCPLIGKLNCLLSTHPAFSSEAEVSLIQHGPGNVIAARRGGKNIPDLLILLNLDCENPAEVHFQSIGHNSGKDLLTGRNIELFNDCNGQFCKLSAGEGLCIAFDGSTVPERFPDRTDKQLRLMASAMAQNAVLNFSSLPHAANADADAMCKNPEKFAADAAGATPAPLCIWHYPQDQNRMLMAAPGDLLMLDSKVPFIAEIRQNNSTLNRSSSLQQANGKYFSLIRLPRKRRNHPETLEIFFTAFEKDRPVKCSGKIIALADPEKRQVRLSGPWQEAADRFVFGSNNKSSYAMFNAQWGKITSKYDAILAVNSQNDYPDDRYVMFSSCRAWLVVDGYSQELTAQSLETYSAHPGNRAKWDFLVPDGRGGRCSLSVEFRMAEDQNCVELKFHRKLRSDGIHPEAKLILRPDLEDRVNHTVTRACEGAEHRFRNAVKCFADGFDFQPDKRNLQMRISSGDFCFEPEWRYMIDLPQERYYGMADKTDLFSPGYFSIPLAPDDTVTLYASAEVAPTAPPKFPPEDFPVSLPPESLAADSLRRFTVRRDDLNTVIAGYPWFLDWGRDTLIVLRGLVKFPEFREQAAAIIRRFAAFERNGTIPNMICGGNDSNRDTSDAPLYLITAVRDYIAETGNKKFLSVDCGGRSLRKILHSIVDNYRRGTPNGIIMDETSGLIFSPSHFSWMDTNYPAGTPREGYPVEIQSLWFAALDFLGEKVLAEKVRRSISELFFTIPGKPSDCLHCRRGTPAAQAVPDDHLRCNILTAITLGAVNDKDKQLQILNAAARLLVPGAIRTLDDSPVDFLLPVSLDGRSLNNPSYPYKGHYRGPEDTERKAAYHNGTAWCWPFPAFCEALFIVGGEKLRRRAWALLLSAVNWMENGVIGEMPEVLDGNMPHRHGGCLAQAWSVSEFYRVLKTVKRENP